MHFNNIDLKIHKSEQLSAKQIQDLEIADSLIESFNKVLNEELTQNRFIYDGAKLNSTDGYAHNFLEKDIIIALKNDETSHLNYIKDFFDSLSIEYSVRAKRNLNTRTVEEKLNTFLKYYRSLIGLSRPSYFSSENYSNFINSEEQKLKNG